ncbi:hypothetical protein LINGRAHAP2_LOCUS3115, partial [Linum grandiflorum]
DRLSDLPDFVLYQILSLLTTRTVIQLSVLSKRWRCIWNTSLLSISSIHGTEAMLNPNTSVTAVTSTRFCHIAIHTMSPREDCEPGDKVKRFRVSGLQLLTLELVDMVLYDFEVCAPKLKSLTVWEGGLQESMEFSFSTLLSLEHVDVRLCSIKDRKQLVCFFQRFPSITSLT